MKNKLTSAVSRIKKTSKAGSWNFSRDIADFQQNYDRQLQISDSAQNFNFAPKISVKCESFSLKCCIFKANIFYNKKNFQRISDSLKLREGDNCPSFLGMMPLNQ